jgi:hypothetical protein
VSSLVPTPPAQPKAFTFILGTGADTGGAAIRSVEAFKSQANVHNSPAADWIVRSMVSSSNYIQYPTDLRYSQVHLESYYDQADVVHLNHTLIGHDWYDAGQGKPTILEHHGLHEGSFAIDFAQSIQQGIDIGAIQIGSTANLELFGPPGTITWAPIPYDLDALAKLRRDLFRPADTVRIVHAPTVRAVKSTETLILAVETLKSRGLAVELVLIERETHEITLKLKASMADIFVDQLRLGYGCNAIEAWGMGLPVVGGIEDPVWRERMVARWGGVMPLYEATETNLADRLERLLHSPDLQQTFAGLGVAHVERWHNQAFHVHQMAEIYANAKPTVAGGPFTRRRLLPGANLHTDRNLHNERLARLKARGKL